MRWLPITAKWHRLIIHTHLSHLGVSGWYSQDKEKTYCSLEKIVFPLEEAICQHSSEVNRAGVETGLE